MNHSQERFHENDDVSIDSSNFEVASDPQNYLGNKIKQFSKSIISCNFNSLEYCKDYLSITLVKRFEQTCQYFD